MLELKGYITNLKKYNEGCLVGEWVTFPIDEEELSAVYDRIGINEQYEEFFFTDWDCELDLGLGEYVSINSVNELMESLQNWDVDLLNVVIECWGLDDVLESSPDDFILYTDINSDYDLGYYYIEETGCYNLNELGNLKYYIDYEKFGRDVRLESDGFFSNLGWVERVK